MLEIRKNGVVNHVLVEEAVSEGRAMARLDGMVVFVEGAVPGDVADLQITKVKPNYAEARTLHIHQPSPHRKEPFCQHFGTCGGCQWQHLDYTMQLHYKQKQVTDAFERIGMISQPPVLPIIASLKTKYYRNRLDFTFSNKRWLTREELTSEVSKNEPALGFHVPKKFDKILDIKECFLQDDLSNEIRVAVKNLALKKKLSFYDVRKQEGFLRNLVIRNTSVGQWMVIIVFLENKKDEIASLLGAIADQFPQINSLLYIINPKKNDTFNDLDIHVYKGLEYILEEMPSYQHEDRKLRFKISAKSFYQTNSEQAHQLYKTATDMAVLTGKETVYDLYTGTGTIANFVASSCSKVIGIDYVEDAIVNARENSRMNGVDNTEFFAGDVKQTFTPEFVHAHGKPDVIITDPPRAGMHEDTVKFLSELSPQRIIYVSCNPATQARDIKLLSNIYQIEKLQPVDMFPHTSHVENVASLILSS